MANEEKVAILTLRDGSNLTDKTRRFLANWLRAKADEIEHDREPYAKVFRASLWSGRGLGWIRKRSTT